MSRLLLQQHVDDMWRASPTCSPRCEGGGRRRATPGPNPQTINNNNPGIPSTRVPPRPGPRQKVAASSARALRAARPRRGWKGGEGGGQGGSKSITHHHGHSDNELELESEEGVSLSGLG